MIGSCLGLGSGGGVQGQGGIGVEKGKGRVQGQLVVQGQGSLELIGSRVGEGLMSEGFGSGVRGLCFLQ